jgi:hypothetical protein
MVTVIRVFCSATRNFAKRQLNWYRKDHMFLFVDMDRKNVPKEVAYATAAEEVWHWATAPREEYDAALSQQLAVTAAVTDLRRKERVPEDYLPDTPAKRLALSWLLYQGELKTFAWQSPLVSEKKAQSKQPAATPAHASEPEKPVFPGDEAPGLVGNALQDLSDAAVKADLRRWVQDKPPPAWMDCLFDASQGVTPENVALWNPEWSALCEYY